MSNEIIKVSSLNKTWILDLDGTIVKHNGYKLDGYDSLLPGAREFMDSIDKKDMIIFITSRTDEYRKITEQFLMDNDIRYDSIIYNAPYGERILINDRKTCGLDTSISINTNRDEFMKTQFHIDNTL